MTKKQLRIPFKDGKPCKWVKDDHDEERDNYEFEECLEIHGFVLGRERPDAGRASPSDNGGAGRRAGGDR